MGVRLQEGEHLKCRKIDMERKIKRTMQEYHKYESVRKVCTPCRLLLVYVGS